MRNYIQVKWVKGDVFDDTHTFVVTVYAPNSHGANATALLDAYMATQSPLWTMERSDPGPSYVLVSSSWVVNYLTLSGPLALVVSKFVWDSIKASEKAIVGDDTPRDAVSWGYKSEKPTKTKTTIVKPLDFVDSLRVLAGAMVLTGFPTGRGSLLAQLFVFITALINDPSQSTSDPKLIKLLDEIQLAIDTNRPR